MKTCEHCGGQVHERPGKPNRFCSIKCGVQHKSTQVDLVCVQCGKSFRGYAGRTHCSLKCVHASMRLPERVCEGCGCIFAPEKTNTRYHNKECEIASRRKVSEPNPIPGARWIALTQGKFALIDEQDFERVSEHSWHAYKGRSTWYARSDFFPRGTRIVRLHRFILNVTDSKVLVDHIDGNGLNCRRGNLRKVNNSRNQMNTRKGRGYSKYKGVSSIRSGKFKATIRANNVTKYLGVFINEEDAARAYDDAARAYHGSNGRYNFPHEGEKPAFD